MPRLSRLGMLAVLAAALSAPSARAVEPNKLLPSDADTVTYINFKQLVESDVIKKFALEQIKQALAGEEAKKFLEQMGLDPLKDVEKVWVGSSGKDQNDMKALVVILGKFDPEKLFKAAEAATKRDGDKFAMIKDGAATMFKYQPDQGNPLYGTVVNGTTLVAGTDKNIIANALKQQESSKPAPIKKELTDLVKGMEEKATMFAVSLVKGKLDNVRIPAQISDTLGLAGVEKALPKTDTLTIVLKVTGDIGLEVVFGMADDDSATDMDAGLAKAIDNIKALVPILAAADPKAKPLTDVVKTLKVGTKKKNVTISGKISGENLGKMINPAD